MAQALNRALRDAMTADDRPCSSSARTSARSAGSSGSPTAWPREFGERPLLRHPAGRGRHPRHRRRHGDVRAAARSSRCSSTRSPTRRSSSSPRTSPRCATAPAAPMPLPIVIRVPYGGGIGGVEHHCDSSEAYYAHTPGPHVVTPGDRRRRLRAAARGHRLRRPGGLPGAQAAVLVQGPRSRAAGRRRRRSARAAVRARAGRDVTLITYGPSRARLPGGGRGGARTRAGTWRSSTCARLVPFDDETVWPRYGAPAARVVVHEARASAASGGEIAARVTERCFHHLEAPVLRVAGFDIPYPPPMLERHHLPGVDRILDAVAGCSGTTRRTRCSRTRDGASTFLLPDLGEGLTEAEIVQLAGRGRRRRRRRPAGRRGRDGQGDGRGALPVRRRGHRPLRRAGHELPASGRRC